MTDQVVTINGKVETIKNTFNASAKGVESKTKGVETRLNTYVGTVKRKAAAAVKTLNDSVNAVEVHVDDIEMNVDNLAKTLNSSFEIGEDRFNTLQSKVTALGEDRIDTLQSKVTALEARLDSIQSWLESSNCTESCSPPTETNNQAKSYSGL